MSKLSMMIAMDKNKLIGDGNNLPWHLPADLKFFKKITTDNIIVMGRKTYESIGKPLPNRINIVITSDLNFKVDNVIVFNNLEDFYNYVENNETKKEIIIIGGASLIHQMYDKIDNFYITHIDHEFKGDCYVDYLDVDKLNLIKEEKHIPDDLNAYFYNFCEYRK